MSKPLTPKEIQRLRRLLLRIQARAAGTTEQIEEESLDLAGGGLDTEGDEGADREFEEVDIDSLEIEASTASAAAEALERIEDGTYGRCTRCDAWIPRARLAALPHAARCIPCQERIEAAEAE